MAEEATACLEDFSPVRGKLDRSLLAYGPLWVLAQLNATALALVLWALYGLFHSEPQMITWAVASPVYGGVLFTLFVESLVMRRFLSNIATTFGRLWEGDVLPSPESNPGIEQDFAAFLRDFEEKLNSRHRLWLGVGSACLGLLFFWITGHLPHVLRTWLGRADWVTKVVVTVVNVVSLFVPAALVGYAMGVGVWKSIVTGLHVSRFSKTFDLVVRPSHPDRAGGLKPLGDLILSMAAMLIIASLALSGLTVYAGHIAYWNTWNFSRVSLGMVVILSLVTFFLPLINAHNRMLAEKRALQGFLFRISRRVAELERSTRIDLDQMDHNEREQVFAEIDSLTELYQRTTRIPVWPFDRNTLVKFATPQVLSLLSLSGMLDPLIGVIQSLISALSGGSQ